MENSELNPLLSKYAAHEQLFEDVSGRFADVAADVARIDGNADSMFAGFAEFCRNSCVLSAQKKKLEKLSGVIKTRRGQQAAGSSSSQDWLSQYRDEPLSKVRDAPIEANKMYRRACLEVFRVTNPNDSRFDLSAMPAALDAARAQDVESVGGKRGRSSEAGDDDDADSDIDVMQPVEVSLVCPLSNAQFVEPVRNSKCGHTYSKQAIIQHIQSGKRGGVPCPMIGCRSTVTVNQLVPDHDMERELERAAKNQKRRERAKEATFEEL